MNMTEVKKEGEITLFYKNERFKFGRTCNGHGPDKTVVDGFVCFSDEKLHLPAHHSDSIVVEKRDPPQKKEKKSVFL